MIVPDFTLYTDDTAAKKLTVVRASDLETAIDLTGLTVRVSLNTLKNPPDNSTEFFSGVATKTAAASGEIEFALVAADWTAWDALSDPGIHYYDIEVEDGGGVIETIRKGPCQIERGITGA